MIFEILPKLCGGLNFARSLNSCYTDNYQHKLYYHRYLLQSATIEIINYNSEDQLLLTNTTLTSNYENGVLTITMAASVKEYEAAINSVVYNNTVEEPTSDIKRITIIVTDYSVYNATNTSNPINLR